MVDLFNYRRRASSEVHVGKTPLGAGHPLRVQSMTTTPTADVEASVAQCRSLAEAGAEYVRLTAQGSREADALAEIRARLDAGGIRVPLVADIHFNPAVADKAAAVVEKVRINPGNYVDPGRTFRHLEYTDEEYAAELQRLEDRFVQLLDICREHRTALRIGVNHGSLSDRIMSRYGDTPEGIVESCMEFLRVCVRRRFTDVVVSIKASNTVVMVRSVRLLADVMEREGMSFPLHLGVTEAGEGEDGRIKSAAGIGALLADGLGDTLRVSLSEAPENEIPVARRLADYVTRRAGHPLIPGAAAPDFDYLRPARRPTRAVGNIGGGQVPVVVADRMDGPRQCGEGGPHPDYIYCGRELPAVREEGAAYIVDADCWTGEEGTYPVFPSELAVMVSFCPAAQKFMFLSYGALNEEVRACLRHHPEIVVIAQSVHDNRVGELRALVHELWTEGLENPVIFFQQYACGADDLEAFQTESAADMGVLLFDGLCDGVYLHNTTPAAARPLPAATVDATAFAILQATRSRITRTEYISCPGCGRTLYDLQTTIARIKAATAHLTGLKIAIMGCIVNGPGEMADADYGYVGAARGKVSLYRGRTCVEKNIPSDEAVEKLLALIEADGK